MGYNYDDYERQGVEALNAITRLEREQAARLKALERVAQWLEHAWDRYLKELPDEGGEA